MLKDKTYRQSGDADQSVELPNRRGESAPRIKPKRIVDQLKVNTIIEDKRRTEEQFQEELI